MKTLLITLGIFVAIVVAFMIMPTNNVSYTTIPNNNSQTSSSSPTKSTTSTKTVDPPKQNKVGEEEQTDIQITHIKTPNMVRGVYITQQTFANAKSMNTIVALASSTDINSAVIDVASDGSPLFATNYQIGVARLSYMHSRGIYLIARIVALNNQKGGWYDPLSGQRRKTLYEISKRAIDAGFDEINYDYVRYPGPSEPTINVPIKERIANITSLFKFMKNDIRDKINRPISLDIFGSTFIYPEANIGQSMEEAVKYFDYIMPMPYPSHWADGTFGYKQPGKHPYEMVFNGLHIGWDKAKKEPERIAKLRSWIQDFNLESIAPIRYLDYTPEMIHQQIYACEEVGCVGWVLWNPRNQYREASLIIPKLIEKASTTTNATSTTSSSTQ